MTIGNIPILRQQKDWMGRFRKWPFFADIQYCKNESSNKRVTKKYVESSNRGTPTRPNLYYLLTTLDSGITTALLKIFTSQF